MVVVQQLVGSSKLVVDEQNVVSSKVTWVDTKWMLVSVV
jgi:hypothetical protein